MAHAQDTEPTPYELALERIAEAERTGATELDLSRMSLLELPPEIGQLTNLTRLALTDNQLTAGGIAALLAYYDNQAAWHLRQMLVGAVAGLVGITLAA